MILRSKENYSKIHILSIFLNFGIKHISGKKCNTKCYLNYEGQKSIGGKVKYFAYKNVSKLHALLVLGIILNPLLLQQQLLRKAKWAYFLWLDSYLQKIPTITHKFFFFSIPYHSKNNRQLQLRQISTRVVILASE